MRDKIRDNSGRFKMFFRSFSGRWWKNLVLTSLSFPLSFLSLSSFSGLFFSFPSLLLSFPCPCHFLSVVICALQLHLHAFSLHCLYLCFTLHIVPHSANVYPSFFSISQFSSAFNLFPFPRPSPSFYLSLFSLFDTFFLPLTVYYLLCLPLSIFRTLLHSPFHVLFLPPNLPPFILLSSPLLSSPLLSSLLPSLPGVVQWWFDDAVIHSCSRRSLPVMWPKPAWQHGDQHSLCAVRTGTWMRTDSLLQGHAHAHARTWCTRTCTHYSDVWSMGKLLLIDENDDLSITQHR